LSACASKGANAARTFTFRTLTACMAEMLSATLPPTVPLTPATEKEKKMAIETTVGKLINGNVIMVDDRKATVTEINYHNEPLVTLNVHTERFGNMAIVTTDDMPCILFEEGE
jgi:hypothetical protein